MTDRFTWRPTSQSSGTATAKVKRAQFGDGYSQSSADGINPVSRSYQLTFVGTTGELQDIVDFLDRHVGRSFLWTPPLGGDGFYQCDSYSDQNQGGTVFTLTATFQQVFEP